MTAWGWLTRAGVVADWRDDAAGPLAGPLTAVEAAQLVERATGEPAGPMLPLALDPTDRHRLGLTLDGRLVARAELRRDRAWLVAPRATAG